jgi:excisionase family DNA binding protein
MSNDQLLTLQQVAERLQVSMSTVRRLVDAGKLRSVRIGRNLRVRPEDLAAYIEEAKQ